MKKIVLGIFLLFNLQIYGQEAKDFGFTQKVFYSGFTADDRAIWPQVNNEFYFLLVKDSTYITECTNPEKKAYLLPKGAPKLDSFQVSADILPDKNRGDNGMAGIAIDIQDKLSGGYLVQVNSRKQFRIVSIDGEGTQTPLSNRGRSEGWVSYKGPKEDVYITLTVNQVKGRIYVAIDGKDVFNFENPIATPGQCGLFISGIYKAKVKNFGLYQSAGGGGTATGKIPTDVLTLNNALLDCKKQNKELSDKIVLDNQELAQARYKNKELQTYISDNLDVKLQNEAKAQKERADKLQAENDKLKAQMEELQELKRIIDQNKDADLVTVLSENLKKEQQKNAELEKKIKQLTGKKTSKKTK